MTECDKNGHRGFTINDLTRKICLICKAEEPTYHIAGACEFTGTKPVCKESLTTETVSIAKLLSNGALEAAAEEIHYSYNLDDGTPWNGLSNIEREMYKRVIKAAISAAIERVKA